MSCQNNDRHSCALPVLRDEDHVISHECKAEKGGTKTVGAPDYVLVVQNPENGTDFLPGS